MVAEAKGGPCNTSSANVSVAEKRRKAKKSGNPFPGFPLQRDQLDERSICVLQGWKPRSTRLPNSLLPIWGRLLITDRAEAKYYHEEIAALHDQLGNEETWGQAADKLRTLVAASISCPMVRNWLSCCAAIWPRSSPSHQARGSPNFSTSGQFWNCLCAVLINPAPSNAKSPTRGLC